MESDLRIALAFCSDNLIVLLHQQLDYWLIVFVKLQ